MNIIEKLNIKNHTVTFVGAGGKTSLMFHLAKEFRMYNKSVLVTTTTKIYFPQNDQFDFYFNFNDVGNFIPKGKIVVIGNGITKENKIIGLSEEEIRMLKEKNIFDVILIEGDGAKGLPIKAPESFEPVIPSFSDMVLGIIGIDSFNSKINEQNVFRVEKFCEITDSRIDENIDEFKISKLINSSKGLFKNSPYHSRKIVVINKVDDEAKKEYAKKIFNNVDFEFAISSIKNRIFEKWR